MDGRVKNIVQIVIFALGCVGSLFLVSPLFVNGWITIKRYGTVLCAAMFALCVTIASLFIHKYPYNKSYTSIAFAIIGTSCSLPVIYGILQYSGVLHGNGGFRITGSFDNPAGFAASLCAGLPAVFYRVLKNRACQNWFTAIVDSHWRIGLLFGLRK